MKRIILSLLSLFYTIAIFAQRGRYYDDEPSEPIEWSEVDDTFLPGLVIFLIGLAIMNIFKNSSNGRTAGGCVMAFGAFLGLGGFLLFALQGVEMVISAGIVLFIAYYVFTEFIAPNIPQSDEDDKKTK